MAPWQVEFFLVPHRAMQQPRALTDETVRTTDWWTGGALPADYRSRLSAVLPSGPDSTAERETWGALEGNRIEVIAKEGRVAQVIARVDVRRLDATFSAGLLGFAKNAQAVLLRGDGLVAEPTVSSYSHALRTAPAARLFSERERKSQTDE